jgi:hypothetical protein
VFSYKYTPANNPTDSAWISIQFKQGGNNISFVDHYLHASPNYQLVEIPFNAGAVPDTAIITIQSSIWSDTLPSSIGNTLIIDEIHFKSQPLHTGIHELHLSYNDVSFYPNPFKSSAMLVIDPSVDTKDMEISILDITGRVVKNIVTSDHRITIDRGNMENGIYFYQIKANNKLIKTGKFITE